MKRIGLLLAAVLTLALWAGAGTAAADGGLPLIGGGQDNGQSNHAIVVQNVAAGNTIQGIGNQAGSNGAVAVAAIDQTNVDQSNGQDPGKSQNCGCEQPGPGPVGQPPIGPPGGPASNVAPPPGPPSDGQDPSGDQQNGAIVVQNVASGNTIQGIGNRAGSNGAVAVAGVDQSNTDAQGTDGNRCSCGDSGPSKDQGSSPDQQNGAIVVQNVASGNTIQGAFNHAGSNGAVAVADVDQQNVAGSQGDSKWSKGGDGGKGSDQSNHAVVVQNVASGNTVQLIGNKAGSNGAVAVAGVDQQNVAGSHGDSKWSQGGDGGKGGEQSNHALVVQNVASGNTIQGAFNHAGSNGAVAVADVDQQNVADHGSTWKGKDDGKAGKDCGTCEQPKPEPKPCPKPKPEPCPKPKPEPCPKPKPEPCPKPKPAPCPPPKPEPCPEPKPAPCPPPKPEPCPKPKPCPEHGQMQPGGLPGGLLGGLI